MKKTIFERRRELAKSQQVLTVGFYNPEKDTIHHVEQIKGNPRQITDMALQIAMLYQTGNGQLPASVWFAASDDDFRVFCLSNDADLLTDGLCERVEQKLNWYKLKKGCFQA